MYYYKTNLKNISNTQKIKARYQAREETYMESTEEIKGKEYIEMSIADFNEAISIFKIKPEIGPIAVKKIVTNEEIKDLLLLQIELELERTF